MKNHSLGLTKKAFTLFVSASLFVHSYVRADETASAQQILAAFNGTCASQGTWTQNAINQSLSLITALQTIQKDPACASVNGALTQLQTLSNRIGQLSTTALAEELSNLKAQESSLLLEYASATNPVTKSNIGASLTSIEGTLASLYGSSPRAYTAIKETNALSEFTAGTQVALSQLVTNQACLMHNPGVLGGIASLAGSVAAGTLSAGASLATAAGVSVVNTVVEFIRQHRLQKKINQFADPLALTSFECALESISNSWCAAKDANNIITLKEKSLTQDQSLNDTVGVRSLTEPKLLSGITLMDQDLPIFLNWLNQVRAGNDANTLPESERQAAINSKIALVENSLSFRGIFIEGKVIFDGRLKDGDLKGAYTLEKTLILQYLGKIGGGSESYFSSSSGPTNPLFEVYTASCSPYYLLGLNPTKWPRSPQGSCQDFSNFDPLNAWPDTPATTFIPNLDTVLGNVKLWAESALGTVRTEQGLVVQADASSVFFDASHLDIEGRSPYLATTNFIEFLKAQKDQGGYFSDTIRRLLLIQKEIDAVILAGGDPDNANSRAAIKKIYQDAQLTYGPTLFQGRIQRAIRSSLDQLVLTGGSGMSDQVSSQLLAANDLIAQLEMISGKKSFKKMRTDIWKAQTLSESTLTGFGDTFGPNLSRGLQHYADAAENDIGSDKYKQSKATLCLMLLAIPTWPDSIPTDYCRGEQLPAEMEGGPVSAKIDENTFTLPHEQRACLYRDYLRATDNYQFYRTRRTNSQK